MSHLSLTCALIGILAGCQISACAGYLDTNLLAVAVGYQTERILPCGVKVPYFSLDAEAGNGNERGVLFAVIAPTNLCGKFFWLAHEGPADNSGQSFYDHRPDGVYSFRFGKHSDDPYQLVEEDLFAMPSPARYLCTVRPFGKPFYLSGEEVDQQLALRDKWIKDSNQNAEDIRKRIATESPPKQKLKQWEFQIRVYESDIRLFEQDKQKIKERRGEIERNRKIISPYLTGYQKEDESVSPYIPRMVFGDPPRPSVFRVIPELRVRFLNFRKTLWDLFSTVKWRWGDDSSMCGRPNLFSFFWESPQWIIRFNGWRSKEGNLAAECVLTLRRDAFNGFRYNYKTEDISVQSDL
ncbi:MAG: hypothetical protein J6334_03595 [Kiritimatiellae bacterium]|nr:hypothetical protein [Kiritimatiellia bacterium]